MLKAPGPVEQPSPTALGLLTAPSSSPPKARTADCSFLQIFNTSLQVTPRGFTKPYRFSLSLPHTFVNSAFINSISVCSLSLPRTLTKIICKCICPSGMQICEYTLHIFLHLVFFIYNTLWVSCCVPIHYTSYTLTHLVSIPWYTIVCIYHTSKYHIKRGELEAEISRGTMKPRLLIHN